MSPLRIAVGLVLFGCVPLHAADLSAIERKIAKVPPYAGKPTYCLLVFGPEAKTRVWLALDGDKLYVDRNANGDLTDDGPAIDAKIDGEGELAIRSFTLPDLHVDSRHHKQLSVGSYPLKPSADRDDQAKELLKRDPDARAYGVSIDYDWPGRSGSGLGERVTQMSSIRDAEGFLQFSEKPSTAPIIQFGGPMTITFFSKDKLTIGREFDLVLALGTPGIGVGTTAFVAYDKLVPENLFPIAEIAFPPLTPGEPPIKKLFELKERC